MKKSITIPATLALTLLLSTAGVAYAMGNGNGNNGNGNGNGNSASVSGIFEQPLTSNPGGGQGQAVGQSEQRRQERELEAAAREERKDLKRLSERELMEQAENGDRLAQLVLAEELADEAQQFIDVPAMANDALSEAIEWYATAAQRGTPGSLAVDNVVPSPAIRVIRSAP